MISVFTPTNNTDYLQDCYNSMTAQTHDDWEWIVVPNGEIKISINDDPRVKVVPAPEGLTGVGALKKFACEQASGDILVELDHDDWLMPTCLSKIEKAFLENPDSTFVFSDFSYINQDGTPSGFMYQGRWNYETVSAYGKMYHKCCSPPATPENVGVIWYAPNHVRSFPRWAYEKVGGYDESLRVLDDQDLMIKLFKLGDFTHIKEMLYLQRMHSNNTQIQKDISAEIQSNTVEMYKKNIDEMYEAWTQRLLDKARLITPEVV